MSSLKTPTRRLPSNIKFRSSLFMMTDRYIKKLFTDIFYDYLSRFKVECVRKRVTVYTSSVYTHKDPTAHVGISVDKDDEIFVYIGDPYLTATVDGDFNIPDTEHYRFVEVICHEFTHVMQALTGNAGIEIDRTSDIEEGNYLLDPHELQARAMEMFYTRAYGQAIVDGLKGLEWH